MGVLLLAAAACAGDRPTAVEPTPPPPVHSVAITSAPTTMTAGESVRLTAVPRAANGTVLQRPVAWTSLTPSVATITADGQLTAVVAGEATIVASSGGVEGRAQITVLRRPAAAVALAPAELVLEEAATGTATATVRDATGAVLDGAPLTWSSSDPTVVEVSQDGRITARREGSATVYAQAGPVRGEMRVSVRPVAVARVVTSVTSLLLEIDDVETITARTEAADGRVLTGRLIYWGSSAPHIVRAGANGRLEALSSGEAVITVGSEGRTAEVRVQVLMRPANPLVFDRVSAAGSELFVRMPTGVTTRLNAGDAAREPSMSPDGQRVVFAVSQRDLTTGQMLHDLFIVNRDGLNPRHLTRLPGVESEPVWSPDGTHIAFTYAEPGMGFTDIYVVRTDGTGLVNITAGTPWTAEMHPAWSPDGAWLAFTTLDALGMPQIETIRRDGTGRVAITRGSPMSAHPTWSPDGRRLAFTQLFATGGSDIVIVPREGGTPTRLMVPGDESEPVWSPDGQHFAFTRMEGERSAIWTVRVDGTVARRRLEGRHAAWVQW